MRSVVTRGGVGEREVGGEGELDEGRQKAETSCYKISTRDVMYNTIKIKITVLYVIYENC